MGKGSKTHCSHGGAHNTQSSPEHLLQLRPHEHKPPKPHDAIRGVNVALRTSRPSSLRSNSPGKERSSLDFGVHFYKTDNNGAFALVGGGGP